MFYKTVQIFHYKKGNITKWRIKITTAIVEKKKKKKEVNLLLSLLKITYKAV